jgi:hypothetical protein
MSFLATTSGVSGEDVRDLMLAAVEHRFGPVNRRRRRTYGGCTSTCEIEKVAVISDEMRAVVESEWPEFAHKLPPRR